MNTQSHPGTPLPGLTQRNPGLGNIRAGLLALARDGLGAAIRVLGAARLPRAVRIRGTVNRSYAGFPRGVVPAGVLDIGTDYERRLAPHLGRRP